MQPEEEDQNLKDNQTGSEVTIFLTSRIPQSGYKAREAL